MTERKTPPIGSRFAVTIRGKNPGAVRFLEPKHTTLGGARAHRTRCAHPPEETAIYKLTWGQKVKFIEGSKL